MPRSFQVCVMCLAISLAGGCGDRIGYDEGYDDGYAVGYNTTCKIRSTMVHGEWENSKYAKGYADGQLAGSEQCLKDGGPDHWRD